MENTKLNKLQLILFLIIFLLLIFLPVFAKILVLQKKLPLFNYFANGNWLAYYGCVLTLTATSGLGIVAYSLNKQIKNIYEQANNINKYSNLVQEKSMKAYIKIDEQKSICNILDNGSIFIELCLENLTPNIITDISYEQSDFEFAGTDSKNDSRPQNDKYLFISNYNSWTGSGVFNLGGKFESKFNIDGFENIAFAFSFKAIITSIYGFKTEQYFNVHFMKCGNKYSFMGYKTIADKS